MKPLAITITLFTYFLLLSSNLAMSETGAISPKSPTSDALKKPRVAEKEPTSSKEASEKKKHQQLQLGKIRDLLDKERY